MNHSDRTFLKLAKTVIKSITTEKNVNANIKPKSAYSPFANSSIAGSYKNPDTSKPGTAKRNLSYDLVSNESDADVAARHGNVSVQREQENDISQILNSVTRLQQEMASVKQAIDVVQNRPSQSHKSGGDLDLLTESISNVSSRLGELDALKLETKMMLWRIKRIEDERPTRVVSSTQKPVPMSVQTSVLSSKVAPGTSTTQTPFPSSTQIPAPPSLQTPVPVASRERTIYPQSTTISPRPPSNHSFIHDANNSPNNNNTSVLPTEVTEQEGSLNAQNQRPNNPPAQNANSTSNHSVRSAEMMKKPQKLTARNQRVVKNAKNSAAPQPASLSTNGTSNSTTLPQHQPQPTVPSTWRTYNPYHDELNSSNGQSDVNGEPQDGKSKPNTPPSRSPAYPDSPSGLSTPEWEKPDWAGPSNVQSNGYYVHSTGKKTSSSSRADPKRRKTSSYVD